MYSLLCVNRLQHKIHVLYNQRSKWSLLAFLGNECKRNIYWWICNGYRHSYGGFSMKSQKSHNRQGVGMNLYMHPFDFSEKWKFIVTPLLGEGGKNVMGVWGWSKGMCLYICFHIKAYLVANWIWSNFRKVKIHRNPLLGGGGGVKNVIKGVGCARLCAWKKSKSKHI